MGSAYFALDLFWRAWYTTIMDKRFITIFLILFILLAGGVLGFYYYKGAQTAPFVVPNPQPTPSEQIPKDWKTYRNEEYGFEISYPIGWHQSDSEAKNVELIVQDKDGKGVTIEIHSRTKDKKVEDEDIFKAVNFKEECKNVLFADDYNGYECLTFGDEHVFIFSKKDLIFIIEDHIYNGISKEVFSTFRFLQ